MPRLRPIPSRQTAGEAPRPENHSRALIYAQQGIRLFPCNVEKRPLVKDWFNAASADETKINEWWNQNPEALIGIPMKHIDCFAVDCDRHSADEDGVSLFNKNIAENSPLPEHPIINTPNNGEHHIFRQPQGDKIGNKVIAPGLETRGCKIENDGGYIIAPGTVLPDGRGWKLAAGSPSFLKTLKVNTIPQASPWLIDTLRGEPKREWKPNGGAIHHQSGKRESAYAAAALDNAANEIGRATKGSRNNSLNIAAMKMASMVAAGWIEASTVADALYDACIENGLVADDGADSVQKTLASGFKAGLASPHAELPNRHIEPPKIVMEGGKDRHAKQSDKAIAASKPRDWSDPDWSILDDRRGDLPEFPLKIFSAKIQEVIKRTAQGAGVTSAHVAVPLIGIVSALIGTARRIKAKASWSQPATCWTVVVGPSGTGKTPGLNVTKRPLKNVEQNNKPKDDERQRKHETKREAAEAERKKWQAEVKEAVELGRTAPEMPAAAVDPGKFVAAKLLVSDGTIERLADLHQGRPQGILLLRDELSALFTNMSRYSGGQDNEFWLEAWNGDSYTVERMGRTLYVDHLLIGVTGGMQPDKLARSFEGDHDGMYARILFAWPPEAGCSDLNGTALEIDIDILNALGCIDRLSAPTKDGIFVSREIPLSDDARNEFAQFLQFAHQGKAAFEGRERDWYAKMSAHVLRLADTLCLLDWAMGPHEGAMQNEEPKQIDAAFMAAAIKLVRDYFWPHARACLRQIGLTERHTNARRVLRWLAANHKKSVSREDVRREALSQRLDANGTEELLATLCNFGWMSEKVIPSGPQGGRPPRLWLVNPILFKDTTAETARTAETAPS